MPSIGGIFERVRLNANQLRTVAERRFGDAQALCATGENERANGAMYLAGFVIECLLKAHLLERFPHLGPRPAPADENERRIWSLLFRLHDLDEMLEHLPELRARLQTTQSPHGGNILSRLKTICGSWTVFARYSPRSATIREASSFLGLVRELKKWLR